MNKRGKVITEILVMMIVIMLTSAIILFLVQSGLITVKAEGEQAPVLNTEFIPLGREGYLAVKDFKFCIYVDENYNCLLEKDSFFQGDEVHLFFVVESTAAGGKIMLIENYRLKDPSGKVLVDIDAKNNYHFEMSSKDKQEIVSFKDYFTLADDAGPGEYTLELVLENPLLNKKITLSKTFLVEETVYLSAYDESTLMESAAEESASEESLPTESLSEGEVEI